MRQKSLKGIALTDATGSVAERYEYDDYGRLLDGASLEEFDGQPLTDFTYTGQLRDQESGLFQMRNRYYSPAVGKFISYDPLGFMDGMNLMGYVNSNLMSYVDPFGLAKIKWRFGERKPSNFEFDGDTGVWGSSTETVEEILLMRNLRANLLTFTGPGKFSKPETALALRHYLNGSGDSLDFNGRNMLLGNQGAFNAIAPEILNATHEIRREGRRAKRTKKKQKEFFSAGDPPKATRISAVEYEGPFSTDDEESDWYSAVGGFFARGTAKLNINDDCTSNVGVCIEMADRYNFHNTGTRTGPFGLEIFLHDDLARMHEIGMAQAYNRSGGQVCIYFEFEADGSNNVSRQEIYRPLKDGF